MAPDAFVVICLSMDSQPNKLTGSYPLVFMGGSPQRLLEMSSFCNQRLHRMQPKLPAPLLPVSIRPVAVGSRPPYGLRFISGSAWVVQYKILISLIFVFLISLSCGKAVVLASFRIECCLILASLKICTDRKFATCEGEDSMTLHRLAIFAAVARRRILTRASAELAISEPSVSLHLKELQQHHNTNSFAGPRRGSCSQRKGMRFYDASFQFSINWRNWRRGLS